MRSLRYRLAFAAGTLSATAMAFPVCAYQEAGHYYTVAILAYRMQPRLSDPDAHLVAFCAQLPDQSADLDAVVVYKTAMSNSFVSWLAWAFSDSTGSLAVRRMVSVQQLLHGLTGGSALAVRRVAVSTLGTLRRNVPTDDDKGGERAAALCALGFALHLYGDSYAHQMMGDPGKADPDQVYPTGRGHAWDYHYPDLPLCSAYSAVPRVLRHCDTGDTGRFLRWHQGWKEAVFSLGANGSDGSLTADIEPAVTRQVLALAPGGTDANLWNESQLEFTLAGFVNTLHPDGHFFADHPSSEPCEAVLRAAFQIQLIPSSTPFTCKRAWEKFAAVTQTMYAREPRSRGSSPRDPSSIYLNPVLQ